MIFCNICHEENVDLLVKQNVLVDQMAGFFCRDSKSNIFVVAFVINSKYLRSSFFRQSFLAKQKVPT